MVKVMDRKVVVGFVCALLGLAVYLWARQHSPYLGFGEMVMMQDTYLIKEPLYSGIILLAGGMGLAGMTILALGVIDEARSKAAWTRIDRMISQSGPTSAASIPILRDLMKKYAHIWVGDDTEPMRNEFASMLREKAPAAEATVPALVAAFSEPFSELHCYAACALGCIGPTAAAAAPTLIAALREKSPRVRSAAAEALGRIGRPTELVVSTLIAAVSFEPSSKMRCDAAHALGRIGPAAEAAVPALITALNQKHPRVRSGAASALGGIGPAAEQAVPALVAALSELSLDVRRSAAGALGRIGPAAEQAVPALIAALNDKSLDLRCVAASALGRIGPAAEQAVPALIAAFKENDYFCGHGSGKLYPLRHEAAEALGHIGPAANVAVPALVASLEDESDSVRRYAADALRKINPETAKIAGSS